MRHAIIATALTACLLGTAPLPSTAAETFGGAQHCRAGADDADLREFREEVAYVLRAFPTTYYVNVCVYRESQAFAGGSPGSLIATLDAENVQGLPTQPHPQHWQTACAAVDDDPCVRTHQVRAFLPGTHLESVRLPADPGNSMARVVAIVRDVEPL